MPHKVIIIQRVLPHYRFSLFERLWRELGWTIVTTDTVPEHGPLKFNRLIDGEHPFIKRYPFEFPWVSNSYRCNIPVKRILDDLQPTGVVCEFSMHMNTTYRLPAIRRLRGSPTLLFWSHGFNMDRGLSSPYQRLVQWPRAMISSIADGHVCYSEEGREYLSRYLPRDQLFVAPNTLDAETLRREAGEVTPMTAPGRPHIVTVGRITADKDFSRLMRIFRNLLVDFPQAALTLVGDGPDSDNVRAAAGDELGRRIFMPGAEYSESRIAAYYASADLSVLTGAAGLGVNHAICYRVPIIAYDRTPTGPHHHPEITYVVDGVTGVRVPQNTDEAMLNALRAFLNRHANPRADFAESMRRHVEDHLSLDSMVREFTEVDAFIRRRNTQLPQSKSASPTTIGP